MGLKDAIKVLGSHGGWDSVTAWCPDGHGVLRCAAMWTVEAGRLGSFETLTWQRSERASATPLGDALLAPELTALSDLGALDGGRMSQVFEQGMRTALLVPIRDGVQPLAVLELLTQSSKPPSADLTASLE